MLGGAGADTLLGSAGADILYGGLGEIGGPGFDNLEGGNGDDTLILRADDRATGGAGMDDFHIQAAPSDNALDGSLVTDVAIITDFVAGDDTLNIAYKASDYALPPTVSVTDFGDGTGADILLNGVVVAKVTGAQGLPPASVNVAADYDLTKGLASLPTP